MVKAKLKAFAFHAVATLIVALVSAYLVYGIWYRGKFAEMLGGEDLYVMLIAIELILGPVMSLIIFNPSKPKAELVRDYSLIIFIQISALVYGLYVVAQSRPVYMVFVKDRFEVVVATELDTKDLGEAQKEFSRLPIWGVQEICTESPTDLKEKEALLMSALNGKDIHLIPKYYRSCKENEHIDRAYSKANFEEFTPLKISELPAPLIEKDFKWLPVVSRFGVWTAFYLTEENTSKPILVEKDPFF